MTTQNMHTAVNIIIIIMKSTSNFSDNMASNDRMSIKQVQWIKTVVEGNVIGLN